MERFSFNTAVSAFMVCVNELTDLNCHKRAVLEPLLITLNAFAPHVTEELWRQLGNTTTILDASFPRYDEQYLVENSKEYPVSINGKLRTQINMRLELSQPEVEEIVLANAIVQKWLEGKPPKKIIYVKNKMVNVVV
jgi:leucyl-tRNA synthetase